MESKLLVLLLSVFCLNTIRLESKFALSLVLFLKTDFILLIFANNYAILNDFRIRKNARARGAVCEYADGQGFA